MITPAGRAAAALDGLRPEVARAVVEAEYQRHPALWQRFGPSGRKRCSEDALFHLEFLIAALAIGQDSIFVEYVAWVVQLVCSYGIEREHVAEHLEVLREVVTALLSDDEAAAVASTIGAALSRVAPP